MNDSATIVKNAPLQNTLPAPTSTPPEAWMLRLAHAPWQYPSARRPAGFATDQDVIEVVVATQVADDPAFDW